MTIQGRLASKGLQPACASYSPAKRSRIRLSVIACSKHPPVFYIPPDDIAQHLVEIAPESSWCEFKGGARYWSLNVAGTRANKAAWSYTEPTAGFELIAGYLAFYASRVDECWVNEELVQAQDGDFYGGWITSHIVGPFKGGPGTTGW